MTFTIATMVELFVMIGIAALISGLGYFVEHSRRKQEAKVNELLLEGATLTDVPTLRQLLEDEGLRASIAPHVVEIGFNGGLNPMNAKRKPADRLPTAEVFLVDDGGGVHVIGQFIGEPEAGSGEMELDAMKLAELMGVRFSN